MKAALIASAALILAGTAAYAQDYGPMSGPTYNNSIHQSAGDRDSRGNPKYYHSQRGERGAYRQGRDYEGRRSDDLMRGRSTTGAGSSFDGDGPYYDNSIHQSAGDRDSRGTPKYNNDGR